MTQDTKRISAEEAARLARIASELIDRGDLESAAWRLADAGLLLRRALDHSTRHETSLCGYDEPTGRGALLPQPQT